MKLNEFRKNDIVYVAICSSMAGEAIVTDVNDDSVRIEWIDATPCHSCTHLTEKSLEPMTITEKMRDDLFVPEITLLKRDNNGFQLPNNSHKKPVPISFNYYARGFCCPSCTTGVSLDQNECPNCKQPLYNPYQ